MPAHISEGRFSDITKKMEKSSTSCSTNNNLNINDNKGPDSHLAELIEQLQYN